MLAKPDPTKHATGALQSLNQEYQSYVQERIDEYKGSLSRADILALADEVIRANDEQLQLSEMVLTELVNQKIASRLKIPRFEKWRDWYLRLRTAQRAPTRWGYSSDCPLTCAAQRVEPGDTAVVVGNHCREAALFLAAHNAHVVFVSNSLAIVDSIEHSATREALASRLEAFFVDLNGEWFPDTRNHIAAIDEQTLGTLKPDVRERLLARLCASTDIGGVHVILPTSTSEELRLAPARLKGFYSSGGAGSWQLDQWQGERGETWLTAGKIG